MKILKYFFLIIFVFIYGIGIAVDIGLSLFGGLGGTDQFFWIIPLHFILSTAFFTAYLVSLRPVVLNANIKSLLSGILLIMVSSALYFFVEHIQ